MKKEVVEAFDSVTMPVSCEEKIRIGAARKRPVGKFVHQLTAAVAVLAIMVSLSPAVRAAVENWRVKYFWPDSDITIYEQTDENGEVTGIAGVDTEASPFARMVNGRLYFLGNGEKIDISDIITEETPYFYTYQDDYGLTHFMAVGYSGDLTNYGIYEFIKDETPGQEKWITGTGRNFLNAKTETRYPWVDVVWEKFNVPWPKPD